MINIKQKYLFLSCLFLPILILLSITVYYLISIKNAPKVIVPIVAYDPRSFLSGHYLVFNLTDTKYTTSFKCPTKHAGGPYNACWQNLTTGWHVSILGEKQDTNACQFVLAGTCSDNAFYTKPMQLYIPEEYAEKIGDAINAHRASIELLLKSNNQVSPVRLLIDSKPWQSVIVDIDK